MNIKIKLTEHIFRTFQKSHHVSKKKVYFVVKIWYPADFVSLKIITMGQKCFTLNFVLKRHFHRHFIVPTFHTWNFRITPSSGNPVTSPRTQKFLMKRNPSWINLTLVSPFSEIPKHFFYTETNSTESYFIYYYFFMLNFRESNCWVIET